MNDEFQIQLKIADKYYPYNCLRSQEGIVRKAASNINTKLVKYSSAYSNANFDLKDLLALVAFHVSMENLTTQNNEDIAPLFDKIGQLNNELGAYLEQVTNH
ncbi:MAG: cell division protein ZapA [Dysgonamonadaceae bacterium]|jgi:cell division protein ZapA|nr:cell division protein ZapA [Dysgonamonadaceae bacterium]